MLEKNNHSRPMAGQKIPAAVCSFDSNAAWRGQTPWCRWMGGDL